MKKFFALLLLALMPMLSDAEIVEIDGIYYYFSGNEATVTYSYQKIQDSSPYFISDYSGDVVIPSYVTCNGTTYSVTSIGDNAFSGCSDLTSITIPNSVSSIGGETFRDCTSLTSVNIPNSVTSIGSYVFYGTGWYNAQPDGVLYLDDWLLGYKGTDPTGNITIISGTRGIAGSAFSGCSDLTSISIPNSVTSIGDFAFFRCLGLTSVTIPNSVTSIGESAFEDCSGLISVTIPNSVTSIGKEAFDGCTGLTSITIPNSVTSIGSYAFYGCNGLTSITIPNSVTSIGKHAFYDCSGLTSVTFHCKTIGSWFSSTSSITEVIIGDEVTSIDDRAFNDCYRLTTIYCLNPVPPTCAGLETFVCDTKNVRDKYDVYNYATLHVPMGSKEAYSSAYEWRYFNKIKEDMEMGGNVFYANLVIQQGAEGYTRQAVKTDEQYTIFIGSYGINKLNTVTFNGEDVTSSVVNGYYTTPEIKGESVLSISYEIDTAVNSLSLKDVKVSGYNGEIQIKDIDEPSDVYVYSTDGKLICNVNAVLGSVSLQVQGERLYMVKVGNRTYKVAMP